MVSTLTTEGNVIQNMLSLILKSALLSRTKQGGLIFDGWPYTSLRPMKHVLLLKWNVGRRETFSRSSRLQMDAEPSRQKYMVLFLFSIFSCWRYGRLGD